MKTRLMNWFKRVFGEVWFCSMFHTLRNHPQKPTTHWYCSKCNLEYKKTPFDDVTDSIFIKPRR